MSEWVEYRSRLQALVIKIQEWLRQNGGFDHPWWSEIEADIKKYFQQGRQLRKLLYQLGDDVIIVHDSHDWIQLVRTRSVLSDREYSHPFAFLLDLGAPVAAINHHGDAIWAAILVADLHVEYLCHKYPFLESSATATTRALSNREHR